MHQESLTISSAGVRRLGGLWFRCVASTQLLLVAIYGVCTTWLIVRNSNATPTLAEEATRHFAWYGIGYAAWVLLSYVLLGLVLGTGSWLAMLSWSRLRNLSLTRRRAWLGSAGLAAGYLTLRVFEATAETPRILENVVTNRTGVQLVAMLATAWKPWAWTGVITAVHAALGLVVLAAGLQALSRLERPVRMRLLATASLALVCLTGLGLGLALAHRPAERRDASRPNILVLASDGLRADHLGLYGYERNTSPNIDRFFADSPRFTACYTPQARTLPSWTSLLTGTYPHTHEMRYTWPREPYLEMHLPTLCRELRRRGYVTGAFGDWAAGDFARVDFGFDEVTVGPDAWRIRNWIAQALCQGHPLLTVFGNNPLGRTMHPALTGMPVHPNPEWVTDCAVDAIGDAARRGKPFFIIAFYSETHVPFATKHPYYEWFTDPTYTGRHKLSVFTPNYEDFAGGKVDLRSYFDPQQSIDLYDGAIRSFDTQAAAVLEALKDLRLGDETLVMLTSDHGEELFERPGTWGHGQFFWGDDVDSRVPLVIRDPFASADGPRVIDEPASVIDIMPTLLDRIGAEPPATCEGQSLMSLLRGERGERNRAVFAETSILMAGEKEPQLEGRPYLSYPPLVSAVDISDLETGQVGIRRNLLERVVQAKHRMVRDRQWKLIYCPLVSGAHYELYDVQADPQCRTDVKDRYPEVFARYRRMLWEWMECDPLRVRSPDDHLVRPSEADRVEHGDAANGSERA